MPLKHRGPCALAEVRDGGTEEGAWLSPGHPATLTEWELLPGGGFLCSPEGSAWTPGCWVHGVM